MKVTKGDETRTAVFKETIPEWSLNNPWYSGKYKHENVTTTGEYYFCRNLMAMRSLKS